MIGDKVLYYMNEGDIQSCTNYHGTKLMTHIMETLEVFKVNFERCNIMCSGSS